MLPRCRLLAAASLLAGLLTRLAAADPLSRPGPAATADPLSRPGAASDPLSPRPDGRLRVGVGDRLVLQRGTRQLTLASEIARLGLEVDYAQIWLPRRWQDGWLRRAHLGALQARGITPVVVHYYFGDDISVERVEAERDDWYASLWRMAHALRGLGPVLVVVEPEWNNQPENGEEPLTSGPGFASELIGAARLIRREAPNALVGTCPGDFPGTPYLEPVLGQAASALDFLAFQEMRAASDPDAGRTPRAPVAEAAVDFARYLKRAFGRPLLLGYVAVSSYGGWEEHQAQALRALDARRAELREAGVVGAIYLQLQDDPAHSGYFQQGEKHFGLLDREGRPKPALDAFRAWLR